MSVRRSARDQIAESLCFQVYKRGTFTLSSGVLSDEYIDKYALYDEPMLLRLVTTAMGEMLPGGLDRIAAVELGAVPLATIVAYRYGVPLVIVRKTPKQHGHSESLLTQAIDRGECVAVIEDTVTTGAQALAAVRVLETAGATVAGVWGMIDR